MKDISHCIDAVIETPSKEIIAFPADGLDTTYPTATNPFMNVLPTDFPRNVYSEVHEQSEEYNPDRPAAAPAADPMVTAIMGAELRIAGTSA